VGGPDSGNVAADGNFSIQVLSKALETFALDCVPLACAAGVAARTAPEAEAAFLCNLREHWFTLRSVASGAPRRLHPRLTAHVSEASVRVRRGAVRRLTARSRSSVTLTQRWRVWRHSGSWYNFNSLYPAPEALSQFYLGAYLSSLQAEGYTIFVVRGELPRVLPDAQAGGGGRWVSQVRTTSIA
jgi:ataxin-3